MKRGSEELVASATRHEDERKGTKLRRSKESSEWNSSQKAICTPWTRTSILDWSSGENEMV